jgi:membrane associated rhomboid family serine protease
MLMLLPLGSDEREARTPRATLALLALNALVFVATQGFDLAKAEARETELEQVADWTLRQAGQRVPALAARLSTPALAFLERDERWREELAGTDLRERLESCLEDARQLRAGHPFHRWGFVPARITLGGLVTHQFLHAGFLHLAFNMLFLWTVGGLLERTLGVARFLSVYLVGGVAAALAHAALNPTSTEPAVGASGAVAAAMGAFAVLHARERMRLALVAAPVLVPRVYFVSWPAWVFLGLWLLEQVFYASFGSTALGVAFGAHLGGFAFGALTGMTLRKLGLIAETA